MNYYYDITVNLEDYNYMFYEWDDQDDIEFLKKVPLFQISSKVLKDIVNNEVKVNKEFLDMIYNKAKVKKGYLEYVALFASKNGAVVLEFASNGMSIARSFLQVADECNVLDVLYTIPIVKLDYKIIKKIDKSKDLRIEKKIKDFINLEINTLYNNKDLEKIAFLYSEWFGKAKNNVAEMVSDMQSKLKTEITDIELKIYNLIKLSYNNV